jgi:hypothetical protein
MYYPRRKVGRLLLAKADKISAKLYNNGKGNAFHHLNSQRIFEVCSSVRTFMFFTDHKNLTFNTLKTQCVLRWHTKIEVFSPILHYIEGPRNILADNLSRLHCLVTPAQIAEGKKLVEPAEVSIEEKDEAYFLDQEYSGLYNEDVWESLSATSTYLTLHIRMRIC